MADCKKNNNSSNNNNNNNNNMGQGHHEGGNKYGGLVPRKKPLITKDHARAFFDSADWALCKQQGAGIGQDSAVAVETLLPKLQRTPHQQLPPRRPACTSGRDNLAAE
ncbi:hypothetical protein MLD38_036023 [Melastoma candidum]|uniref:Uncharacterized protein n=1 Tax=Melastoma candidum TaxID=119954 RepID=A0ACB9LID2_9MYRT|nr:hypothetical protein MLD38_036023 [Melastoma candidum]